MQAAVRPPICAFRGGPHAARVAGHLDESGDNLQGIEEPAASRLGAILLYGRHNTAPRHPCQTHQRPKTSTIVNDTCANVAAIVVRGGWEGG